MKEKILEYLTLNRGLEIDIDEGWKKIISRQFGGSPGRGMKELIQNLIDSYPADMPWEKRKGEILTGSDWIRIVDHGSGLDRNKLKLLTTLGGTDKDSDPEKIGTFGMGFFSIFNPRLGTRSVKVTTKCEGQVVELEFDVREPEKIPLLKCTVKPGKIPFSTSIEVLFASPASVARCIEAAEEALKYYPCNISINGAPFQSIWVKAEKSGAFEFSNIVVRGFVEKTGMGSSVHLMCKYEHLMLLSVNEFLTGGRGMSRDLDDHFPDPMPFLPGGRIYVNCNSLNVTISRDSFYLDHQWRSMKTELSRLLMEYLEKFLTWNRDPSYILANQYIFRNEIGDFLKGKGKSHPAVAALAQARIYSLAGKPGKASLVDIQKGLSTGTPLFFSTSRVNIRWVGGNFKHDFIVLPETCEAGSGANRFYDTLFGCVFSDVVNLDTINKDSARLKNLVERGIVGKEALCPECRIVGEKSLTPGQAALLEEISGILDDPKVREAIETHLHIPVRAIRPVWITIQNGNAYISTGILDEGGAPIDEGFVSNLLKEEGVKINKPVDILLGLSLDHPFVRRLIASKNPHRGYYSLTFIAHQLALSQRLLVPYSPFFHLVKEKLAGSMRSALIGQISRKEAAA